jgi:hypothetical protein
MRYTPKRTPFSGRYYNFLRRSQILFRSCVGTGYISSVTTPILQEDADLVDRFFVLPSEEIKAEVTLLFPSLVIKERSDVFTYTLVLPFSVFLPWRNFEIIFRSQGTPA